MTVLKHYLLEFNCYRAITPCTSCKCFDD